MSAVISTMCASALCFNDYMMAQERRGQKRISDYKQELIRLMTISLWHVTMQNTIKD